MRALQSFHQESPANFGSWFHATLRQRPLPWSWDQEDAAMLLRWFNHYGWKTHLASEAPSLSGAAAALAVLLAQAYQSCFSGDGDTAVWKRLSQIMGLPETSFGANVTCLTRHLDLYEDCRAECDLVHVIPFLKLVGCPQQALPSLGQQLRSSQPIRKRFRALVTAQWGADAEGMLKAWLRNGKGAPPFLSPAEAELIQKEPDPVKHDDQGFAWRVLQLASGAFQAVLVPTSDLKPGEWKGNTGQSVSAETAKTYGIPQELGRDGLVLGNGQSLEIPWPNEPTFWTGFRPTPKGVKHAYQRGRNGISGLVCLPPQWSLDGEPEPGWRWYPVKGARTLFEPDGSPWLPREEATSWDALGGISLAGHPGITILHTLPFDLPKLEIRSGRLGSTLPAGTIWRYDSLAVPPLGHLLLTWTTRRGTRRSKEVYCLPTLQLTKSLGERPIVWIRGMQGLVGHEEEGRYYELEIGASGTTWSASVMFRGWGQAPVQLELQGTLTAYGASLYGWKSHLPWPSHGPWYVGPDFPMEAYEANLRIEMTLPQSVEGRIWIDCTAPLWSEKYIKHQRRLGPLEFHDPLKPLWGVIEPMGRPVRLSLAWQNPANEEDERLRAALIARIFPRETNLSVSLAGEWTLQVRRHAGAGDTTSLEDLVVQVGSTSYPDPIQRFPVAELGKDTQGNGILLRLPRLDPSRGPYHIGLRRGGEERHPISIHVDGLGHAICSAAEAHYKAVRGRWIGGVSLRKDLQDYRDQQLELVYDLAKTNELLDLFEPEEIVHWLDYLGDDFLFSQPWTLGIALRHPRTALEHLLKAPWSQERKLQALGNLGQSGWTWWLVHPSEIAAMEPGLQAQLYDLTSQLAQWRVTALNDITNEGVRRVAVARLCEEGLFIPQGIAVRRLFLEQMGFPTGLMKHPWTAKTLAARLVQPEDDFLNDWIQSLFAPCPEPAPLLPNPPVNGIPGLPSALERLTRLSGWGRVYRSWRAADAGSLIQAPSWSEATPEVFRHYGPLFAFFAFLNWQA